MRSYVAVVTVHCPDLYIMEGQCTGEGYFTTFTYYLLWHVPDYTEYLYQCQARKRISIWVAPVAVNIFSFKRSTHL